MKSGTAIFEDRKNKSKGEGVTMLEGADWNCL